MFESKLIKFESGSWESPEELYKRIFEVLKPFLSQIKSPVYRIVSLCHGSNVNRSLFVKNFLKNGTDRNLKDYKYSDNNDVSIDFETGKQNLNPQNCFWGTNSLSWVVETHETIINDPKYLYLAIYEGDDLIKFYESGYSFKDASNKSKTLKKLIEVEYED